jgi:hypothetical protein
MGPYSTQDLQDEFLSVIRTSQETVVEAVKTWVDTVKSVPSKVPSKVPSIQLPLAGKLPTPEDVVTGAYDFAEKLLSSQRQFAEELVKATAPLLPGNSTTEEPGGDGDGGQEHTTRKAPGTPKRRGTAAE